MTPLSLTLSGMSCAGCEQRIANVLGRLDGVGSVQADHRERTVRLDYDPSVVTPETISARLAGAGYAPIQVAAR
ncbi:MAG: heavy-metal-associated domain-containing protein [Actinobacteria bacterium]|nr:heavy-metal-associated domain-containing protein [Actinomycetota bacterium]